MTLCALSTGLTEGTFWGRKMCWLHLQWLNNANLTIDHVLQKGQVSSCYTEMFNRSSELLLFLLVFCFGFLSVL